MWDHLKFTMKRQTRLHQTRLLWTGPCRAKPRHVSPSANKRENTAWLNLTDTTFTKKNPTRCNNVSKFYYSIFICSSKCCRWHTAHHEDPKTALAASGFSYVEGCWTCSWWTLSGIIKFWYIVASCWVFFMNCTMMHRSMNIRNYFNLMDPEKQDFQYGITFTWLKKTQSSQNIVHINILITIISQNFVFKQWHLNYLPLIFLCGKPNTFHIYPGILQVIIWEPLL